MNKYKQSKSSVIFSTCWAERGASVDQIFTALGDAGYSMPVDNKLMPMLKTYQRKGWLQRRRSRWSVGLPQTRETK